MEIKVAAVYRRNRSFKGLCFVVCLFVLEQFPGWINVIERQSGHRKKNRLWKEPGVGYNPGCALDYMLYLYAFQFL